MSTRERKEILRELFRQPDVLITVAGVIIAIIVAILDLLGNTNDTRLHSALLFILAALAFSQIVSQIEVIRSSRVAGGPQQQILSQLQHIDTTLSDILASQGISLKWRNELAPLEVRWRSASTIDVSCITCNDLFASYGWLIRKKWEEGCRVRILVAYDPRWEQERDNDLLASLIFNQRSHTPTADIYLKQIQNGIEILRTEEVFAPSPNEGKVEIRGLGYCPVCSLMVINRQSSEAYVKVEIYITARENKKRPHFFITKQENREWYNLFADQFDVLWEKATPLT